MPSRRCTTTRTTSTINADPYPTFRRLREEAPLYYNEQHDFFALSRYDDVEARPARLGDVQLGRGGILELIKAGVELPPGTLIFEDPPIHDIHRKLLSRVFTPRRMNALEDKVREFCARCLDPLVGADRFDLIAELGAEMPMRTISMLLGIPEADQEAIRDAGRRQPAHRARRGDGGRGGRHARPRHRDVRRLHRLARPSTRPTT